MLIYNYNKETLEYTGMEEAFEDKSFPGTFLMPAYSTTIAPPTLIEGYINIFKDGKWQSIEDIRNKMFYNKETRTPYKFKDLVSNIYSTLTSIEPPEELYYTWNESKNNWIYNLDIHKEVALEILYEKINNKIDEGVDCILSTGQIIKMDSKDTDALKLKNGIDLAIMNNESTINIVDYNNNVHQNININIANEIVKIQANNYRNLWSKKSINRVAINNATSKEQIESLLNYVI